MREGLYPHRIHLFVEGFTEEIVLKKLLPFLGYELPGSGMAITNMQGVDQAQHYEVLFRSATEVAARTVLIADLEGSLAKTLKRLRANGLFREPDDLLLWPKDGHSVDFEEANFTDVELVRAIRTAARRRGVRLQLTVDELRRERAERTRPRRLPPALTPVSLDLARDRGVRFGAEAGPRARARRQPRRRCPPGWQLSAAGERRPLLAQLWRWIVAVG